MSDDFMNQMTGSMGANGLTATLLLIMWFLRNKCKHSKCSSHTSCCDIEINDESEIDLERGEGGHEARRDVHEEAEKELYFLHTPDHQSIRKKYKTTPQVDLKG